MGWVPICSSVRTLLDDFERRALLLFERSGGEDGPHRFRRASLLADHLAEVVLRNLQLDDRSFGVAELLHLDGVWSIDEGLGDELDQVTHDRLVQLADVSV